MKTTESQEYQSPYCKAVPLAMRQVLCASAATESFTEYYINFDD